jgi:Skp family chaperone for outer membrane proteins
MKKVLFVCLAFAASMIMTQTQAQTKIGSFDEESVLGLFPGLQAKADSVLQKFVNDSLRPEYDYELSEYQRKDSSFKVDSPKLNASVKAIIKKEIATHFYKIQNWQQYQNQRLQVKQDEILFPYKQKVYQALDEIIRDQKYTHVLKSDVFLLAPPLDNLSIKVAQKLKLPLPKDVEEALRQAQGGGGDKTPAQGGGGNKTAPKPGPKKG